MAIRKIEIGTYWQSAQMKTRTKFNLESIYHKAII